MEILKDKERILVIQTAFLGDAILTLPMIQKLKEIFPDSLIDVISIPQTQEVFENSPYVNRQYSYDKKGNQKSLFSLFRFARELKKNKYTHLYSPHRSFRTSMLVYLLDVENSFGFDSASLNFVYKKTIRYDNRIHEVSRNLTLIGVNVKNENWKVLPEIKNSPETVVKINNLIQDIKNPIVAIAPGSVWQTKKYPEEHFEIVSKHLIDRNYSVIFIGGQSDFEICERLASRISGKSLNCAGKLSICESIELLKLSKLLICNDSAPTHMGMAANIPVLTIYCSTVPEFGFSPYNKYSSTLSLDGLKCKPCGIHGRKNCPINTFDCGLKLTPETVIQKVEEILTLKEK